MLTSSASAVAELLDTRVAGLPLVVYNPLATARRDPVEATVEFKNTVPASIRVVDRATQRDVPLQVLERNGSLARILFLADMPAVGFKVFEVLPGASRIPAHSSLSVTASSLENARYRVELDSNGDLASIFDKEARHELLKSPARLELRDDPSPDKPAWRILWDTVNSRPREFVRAPQVRVVERRHPVTDDGIPVAVHRHMAPVAVAEQDAADRRVRQLRHALAVLGTGFPRDGERE